MVQSQYCSQENARETEMRLDPICIYVQRSREKNQAPNSHKQTWKAERKSALRTLDSHLTEDHCLPSRQEEFWETPGWFLHRTSRGSMLFVGEEVGRAWLASQTGRSAMMMRVRSKEGWDPPLREESPQDSP